MVYGSHESTPYEHEGRGEPEDVRAERRADAAAAVLRAAKQTPWFAKEKLGELTPELQREVAKALASFRFYMGPEEWPAGPEALDDAWRAFTELDGDAKAIDDAAVESF